MAITISDIQKMKDAGEKITMITTYDATFAHLVETAGIPMILIGDSLGNVMQGHSSTLPVTVDDIIYHARCVRRGCSTPLIVLDMPFGSYQVCDEDGVRNALEMIKRSGGHAVKVEGGARCVGLVRKIVEAGVPVVGHIGLTPQSVHAMSGYRVQGKSEEAAKTLIADAQALERAGAFCIVVECVPRGLGKALQESVSIPIIGIGAGPDTAGQVLVLQDALGLNLNKTPKFARRFAELGRVAVEALSAYKQAVQEGSFPSDSESYHG